MNTPLLNLLDEAMGTVSLRSTNRESAMEAYSLITQLERLTHEEMHELLGELSATKKSEIYAILTDMICD